MINGIEGFVCKQRYISEECCGCEYMWVCKTFQNFMGEIEKEKIEEEKRNHKCFNCVWSDKENLYCPFVNCMKER